MHLRHSYALVFALILSLSVWQPAASSDPEPWQAQLRQLGIEPTRQGIENYLQSLLVTPERFSGCVRW